MALLNKFIIHIKKYKILYFIILLLTIIYSVSLPKKLFPAVYSTIVVDYRNELLGARIAPDGQWRFPETETIPEKYKQCLIQFEDRKFYVHPGVNPLALCRATFQNIKAKKVISGGSTISMQVIRLYRNNKNRNILNKFIEVILATRLELRYTKNEILNLYASHAPFGGNVVGIEAASWRYFGQSSQQLSWAEAALLAVLPNSPALIHPGRNRDILLKKRNNLLLRLQQAKIINKETCQLALLEPIPEKPLALPNLTPQYTEYLKNKKAGQTYHTTLQKNLQENVNRIAIDYFKTLQSNNINNLAAVVIDVKTGNYLAYLGNVPSEVKTNNQNVDCADAPRSTGSILKPILFMAMQHEGVILPGTLIADIPTRIGGFKPENYDLTYEGAVPAKRALARSLNIPAVKMLNTYGIPKFQNLLTKLGMSTLPYSPDHYGLTLIVGGAEGKLTEISSIYAQIARKLAYPKLDTSDVKNSINGSSYLTFEALLEVNRPDQESGWKNLSSSRKIAWKTGTSYGFRDAWAIGITPEYVVGVWAGNASGEGRPGLTGTGAAAPLLFQIFNLLPATSWFDIPYDDLEKITVCRKSGYKAGAYCEEKDTIYAAKAGVKTQICPYHKQIYLTADKRYRITSKCFRVDQMTATNWFVLPPAMEWFYRKKNASYRPLPRFLKGCENGDNTPLMELIYPTESLKILIPKELDGKPGKTVFEIAHRNPDATLYWHLDDQFLQTTKGIHQHAFCPSAGKHQLTVIDKEGHTLTRNFEVVSK
jgi:penicillin-binding protein 1C